MNGIVHKLKKMAGKVGAKSESDHIYKLQRDMLEQERRIDWMYQRRTGHPIGDVLENRVPYDQDRNLMARVM